MDYSFSQLELESQQSGPRQIGFLSGTCSHEYKSPTSRQLAQSLAWGGWAFCFWAWMEMVAPCLTSDHPRTFSASQVANGPSNSILASPGELLGTLCTGLGVGKAECLLSTDTGLIRMSGDLLRSQWLPKKAHFHLHTELDWLATQEMESPDH